jgi:cysteine desulfurase family protein (TIGR01976 family)
VTGPVGSGRDVTVSDMTVSEVAGYDVARVRAHFPAMAEGAAHFDGPGGSQVPDVVGAAVATTLTSAIANLGSVTAAERRATQVVADARAAMADLLGVAPQTVVFGRSMTQLTYDIARAAAKQWGPDDEIVVTRLDHDANIRPWVQAADAAGATVRWIDFDPETGELSAEHAAAVIGPHTRLVAVTGASNLIGCRPPIAEITRLAREVGALSYVDGVHLTPHAAVDVGALGADLYACSPYKFLGPHCGVVAGRAEVLERLHPDKLVPSPDTVPERFELGTLPYELLAGTTAAVDFLAGVAAAGPAEGRRGRILASMQAIEAHEAGLHRRLEDGLTAIDGVTLHGRARHRTPTSLFSVAGHTPRQVQTHLARLGVNAPAGTFYAIEAGRRLGLGDGGAVRAGIAPYTDEDDVDRLIGGVAGLARGPLSTGIG